MSDRSQQMLCKALELAEKALGFYDSTLASCGRTLGREVFGQLKQDKVEHMNRIKEIHDSLVRGKTWIDACLLPEDEAADMRQAFAKMAAKYDAASCPASEQDALAKALTMEKSMLAFYQDAVPKAEDKVEKAFLTYMVQEVRGHTVMLADLQSYYEDPEGWARDSGRGGLDGA